MKFSCRERIVAVEVNIRQRYRDVVRTAVPAETSYSMGCEQESLKQRLSSLTDSDGKFAKLWRFLDVRVERDCNSSKNVSFNLFRVTSYVEDNRISKRN